ncbi:DeoR family transcriptional regulator [Pokkaliibacter plantistimulans]|uniref:DeoR family transcriptional regulator n=1 Tax=Proteobacteria bacterium 228 TaxID=2083153 RepID=A0A2S5KTR8_9PROT|nr:DeoR/GlpR family DNA-binding transcription regulator [Pokkaliibacter plantistimulans]PPC78251.1 DeoR family transcriptional regulator [Pokkaliibacter plantistimulans]
MHEVERHRIILSEVGEKPVVTLNYLVDLLGASEATVRRDINVLHKQGKLKKVRGGAESLHPPTSPSLAGRPFSVNQTINAKAKRAIARLAATLCREGDSIIINGGTTTFFMAEHLKNSHLHVLTNSFVIAEYLLKNSKCGVTLPGGTVYREQNIILSPFPRDVSSQFYASLLFIGAQGVGQLGVMETDPQIVQAETKLLEQAEQRVLLVDSSKFGNRSSLIVCPLNKIDIVITDDGIDQKSRKMIEDAGCKLMIATLDPSSSTAQAELTEANDPV